ncbi:hypothetical protein KKI95_07535 [Xenorhabdus bovienii]|uniref:hypothetical protein n=1 Tax=Xenorhabdus bovienii TaxID=40576 RepID=UPI00237D150E|nr:hypothetical protein [Xenorhabdus bovienii]MDE1474374.1 hypothetical protein [Xenorhabdus bovienii]MDE9427616.1 hypothetical protein [Xenorhabdus bovienii]MDE9432483.1 hypothetical protein [Xenorhabdus bovienii]MDE9435788.1 hypothetical protein [Xenorhabdus bovienii]MDE9466580.1 hypothetical protein [Xenorhabdus bovienii]
MLDYMQQGKFELVRDTWIADYNSPMAFLSIFITAPNNTPLYSNKVFDHLVKKASEMNDKQYY